MTKEEAKIVLLEQALSQAYSTIEFLDGCLKSPGFQYCFPQQIQNELTEIKKLISKREFCFHSMTVPECEGCQQRVNDWNKRDEALKVLEL